MTHGRRRDIGLSGVSLVTLGQARHQAFANRNLARAGLGPIALRRQGHVPAFEEGA